MKLSPLTVLKGSFLLVTLVTLGLFLSHGVGIVTSPFQYDYGEGFHWFISDSFSRGESIYKDINTEPYITAVYTPLYYLVNAGLFKVLGSHLWVGRLVSLVSILAAAYFIYKIVYWKTESRLVAVPSGLLLFTVWYLSLWTVLFRVDSLALALTLAGMYVAVRNLTTKGILWSVPLFVLAFYTKQVYLAAPLAVGIYLLLKDRKLAAQFGGLYVGLVSLLLGVAMWITGGYFWEHTFLVGSQPFSTGKWAYLVVLAVLGAPAVLAVGSAYLVSSLRKCRVPDVLLIYFLLALAIALVGMAKEGAWLNYFIESVAAASILVGLQLKRLESGGLLLPFAYGVVAALSLISARTWVIPSFPEYTSEAYSKISGYMQEVGSDIISEDAALLMRNGGGILWEPSVFVLGGYYKTVWDQTPFVEDLESKRFDLIVLNYDVNTWWLPQGDLPYPVPHERLTEEMATAIVGSYQLKDNIGNYWVYEPN